MKTLVAEKISNPTHAAAVLTIFEADANKDVDRFITVLTPDVRFKLGGMPRFEGREAVRGFVSGFFGSGLFTRMEHRLQAAWEQPDGLIYEAEVTYELTQGKEVTLPYCNVLRFTGDKVHDYRVYIDLGELQKAAAEQQAPALPTQQGRTAARVEAPAELVWRLLADKAEHPERYVPGVKDVQILERSQGGLVRKMTLGGMAVTERFDLEEAALRLVATLVEHPLYEGQVTNEIRRLEGEPGAVELEFTFNWIARPTAPRGVQPPDLYASIHRAVQETKALAEAEARRSSR